MVPTVDGALNTIAGYEAMNIIRKGQIRRGAKDDVVGQNSLSSARSGLQRDSVELTQTHTASHPYLRHYRCEDGKTTHYRDLLGVLQTTVQVGGVLCRNG